MIFNERKNIATRMKSFVKRKNLNYLGLNKFLAMYLIIRMHLLGKKSIPFNAGNRACEFLFLSSGFTVGYNHFYNNSIEFSYITPFKYAYKHLRNFYPYYLLNLFYGLYFHKDVIKINLTNFQLLLINLLLIANWSRNRMIARFYFAISWFLDNIFYCYFLAPFFVYSINNIKNSIKIFAFITFFRILAEEFLYLGAYNIFDMNLHCGPIIRICEFYMGMSITPLYFQFKSLLDKFQTRFEFKILYTVIQIVLPFYLCYLMIKYNEVLLRCYFLLIISVYIFFISYDYGYLSYLSSIKIIKIILLPQMEMYLIQMNVHLSFDKHFKKTNLKYSSKLFYYYLEIVTIFTISLFYRTFFRDKFAKIMDKIKDKIIILFV